MQPSQIPNLWTAGALLILQIFQMSELIMRGGEVDLHLLRSVTVLLIRN